MKIGILALQGGYIEHKNILDNLNVDSFYIRNKYDLNQNIDGLILPGGESTAIGKLLDELELKEPIKKLIDNNLPVYGTCAGMILLSKNIENDNRRHFSKMDIKVKRNAYGRQSGSFITSSKFNGISNDVDMVFIRAPYIVDYSDDVEILSIVNDNIVAAKQKNMLVTSFHPELNNELKVHKYFIDNIVRKNIE
ncbi:MAG: pyridoxal 5'-phosphate synthase glutaminase subunit PdxT [Peptostreptococcaceae bacterium]|jgi:5'-phosphate synthase pdxT subunit|nr:pyridoxal 5'-phosphate synthase glutaminase subunit PdxT [Peptostreptococcaceae bacterium]